jgi:SAM-dependent methyltransferase
LEVGSADYFDEIEQRRYFVEPHIKEFAEFDRWDGKKVLEIGCGIGTDTISFARGGAQITAVELSPKSLELAKKRSLVFGFTEKIDFREADAEELSDYVEPQAYDLIYSFGVIHHTMDPKRVIEQVRANFVRPGSTFKFMVYHRYSWKVLWIMATQGLKSMLRGEDPVAAHSEAQTGCPVTYTYSKKGIRRLLGDGFEIQDISIRHIFPYRIDDYVQYRYVKNWYLRWLPGPAFRWMERHFGWHLCVTAVAK